MKISISNKIIASISVVIVTSILFAISPTLVEAAQPMSCPLRGSSGDVLVNFYDGESLFGTTAMGDVYRDYNARVPAGEYKVTMTTYDNHSGHGGQGQRNEQVYVALRNQGGTDYDTIIARTGSTRDIPENSDYITSTIASSLNLRTSTRLLTVVHADFPGGTESVTPICVLFEKLDEPDEPEEPDPTNGVCGSSDGTTVSSHPSGSAACRVGSFSSSPSDTDTQYLWSCVGLNGGSTDYCSANREQDDIDLDVTCRVSDTSVEVGDEVRFTAEIDGGNYPYEYDWDGDTEGEDGDQTIYVEYDDDGSYYVSVTVTDEDGRRASAACSTVRVDEEDDDDFDITCEVSDTTVEVGDEVRFSVDIDGGNWPFEYEWDGDIEGEDDDERRLYVEYDDEGRYRVEITVTDDDGNEAHDTCSAVRVDDDNDRRGAVRVRTDDAPTGQLASIDSVFLNQVPATGFGDPRKLALFISFLSIWSLIIGAYFYKRYQKGLRSTEILKFKEANKNR